MSSGSLTAAGVTAALSSTADDGHHLHHELAFATADVNAIFIQDRKDQTLQVLKSELMAKLDKEVKSLDDDSWMFDGPRSRIDLISQPVLMSTTSILTNINNIPMLNGPNFKDWKENTLIVLGCMDLDYPLKTEQPTSLTDTSTPDEKRSFEKWEHSNRVSLVIIKHRIPEAF